MKYYVLFNKAGCKRILPIERAGRPPKDPGLLMRYPTCAKAIPSSIGARDTFGIIWLNSFGEIWHACVADRLGSPG